MNKKYLTGPYVFWAILFIMFPMLLMIYFSLTTRNAEGIHFSLESYQRFFDPLYISVLSRSIRIAFMTTVICLLFAYPLAMILNSRDLSNRNMILLLIILPMWMNSLLRTYAWLALLSSNGILNSLLEAIGLPKGDFLYGNGAIVFGMIYNFFPFMVLPIYNALDKIDYKLVEASYDLGANTRTTFRKVILPLSMPGVVTGVIMVFMPSLTTFVITRLLGGGQVVLIGNMIEEQFTRANDWGFGSSLSMILMLIILLTIGFTSNKEEIGKGGSLF